MANEKELMDAVFGEEEPLLPDGWQEGDTLFPEDEQSVSDFGTDGSQDVDDLLAEDENSNSESDDPTTVEGDEGEGQGDDDGTEQEPDGDEPVEEKKSRVLKLKVNHAEEDFDVDATSDEDLAVLLQKGKAFDEWRDRENKKRYREVYKEQLDAGMTEAAAKLIAQNEVGGKSYSLEDEPESTVSTAPETKETVPVRDYRAEAEQLRALYPDLKQIPDEVVRMASKANVPLIQAYHAYVDKQEKQRSRTVEKENRILKQNAASAAKAPVRGVSGGGVAPKRSDPFEKGFDSTDW